MLDDHLPHEEVDVYLKAGFKDPRWNLPGNVEVEGTGKKVTLDIDDDDKLFALYGDIRRSRIFGPSPSGKVIRINSDKHHNPDAINIYGHGLLRSYGIKTTSGDARSDVFGDITAGTHCMSNGVAPRKSEHFFVVSKPMIPCSCGYCLDLEILSDESKPRRK